MLDIKAPPFPSKGSRLVVETMRGTEMAVLGGSLSTEQEVRYRASCSDNSPDGQLKGGEPSLQEITLARPASEEDLLTASKARAEEGEVLVTARALLRNHNLSMKLVDVEYLLDRKKLFFYFTSEQRVDFRAYVRDLAKEFKTRIELRQIGVRDEAKTVKGIAPCGLECCCSQWLHKFTPICIKMVKEQNLALNPTKISGICGRLMCCMSYEHDAYGALWKNLPNPGAKIRTPNGNYVVDGVELTSNSVRIRRPEGGSIQVAVEDFPSFKETVLDGREWEVPSRDDLERAFPRLSDGKPAFSSLRTSWGSRKKGRVAVETPADKAETESGPETRKETQRKADDQSRRSPKGAPAADGKKPSRRRRRKKSPVPKEGQKKQADRQASRPGADKDRDRKDPVRTDEAKRPSGEGAKKGRHSQHGQKGVDSPAAKEDKGPGRRQGPRKRGPGKGQERSAESQAPRATKERPRDPGAEKKRPSHMGKKHGQGKDGETRA
ncbi:MAG: regulatory iron-sulfur-containing complex subunit RicT [Synergistota bacterium]|nr:regulatory iron-sulfur-containing complex subunit RicT [Synergistota bacterium]